MNKLIRLSVTAILSLALLLSGCAGTAPGGATGNLDPQNPITLTLWHYYVGENQQALERAVSTFNQTVGMEHGVIVDAVPMGSIGELETAVTDAALGTINARDMPDIFSSYPDKAMEIDALEMVADLNGYFSQQERQQYVDDFLADGIFDEGKLLLVPIVKSTELMYVNATAWNAFAAAENAGTSQLASWEAVYDTARAYYRWTDAQTPDAAWDGTGFMGFDSVANFIIIGSRQLGVNVIDADGGEEGQAVLDKDALRRIFDIYYNGMCLGYFDAQGKFRSDDIKAGSLIAYVGSSSSAAYFPTWIEQDNTQAPIDFLPLPYPTFEGGTSYAIQQGAGMCVAKSTPAKQEGAVLFLKWFTAPEQNIEFAMTTGYLPVQQAAYSAQAFDTALETLRMGDDAQRNVAGVYEIALRQITEANTYAAKPFEGSYDVRSILQATLMDITDTGREAAAPLKQQGLDEAAILAELDTDAQFESWLQSVRTALDSAGVPYTG